MPSPFVTTMCSTIPTSPAMTPVSPHGAAGQQPSPPHILCIWEACQQPSLPSLFGMPYGHSLSCLLIRRYHMSAVTFCLLLCVPRYQLAQTPVSPQGAAGEQKQPPLLSSASKFWSISCVGKILIYFVSWRPTNGPPYHPSSGCRMATHFLASS